MKTTSLVLLLIGASAHKLSKRSTFASGMAGDEDLATDIIMKGDKFHYQQNVAQAAAAHGSGVRARWIELKDCNITGPLDDGEIVLK